MKKVLIVLCLMLLALPVFANLEQAQDISLDFLNQSVYSKVHSYNQILYADEAKINQIIALYKQNPDLIKTPEIRQFSIECIQRNQNLLNEYEQNYFIPAYKEYRKYDTSMSYEDWKHTIALCETSLFYDFYTFTESNLEDAQKIYERSK